MLPPLNTLLDPRRLPWLYLPGGALALLIQSRPALARALVYDRDAVIAGEWWRLWTGNFVHFGWLHFALDTGLWFLAGWTLVYNYRWWPNLVALALMPLAVTLTIFYFDPAMNRYGGISGINVGLLVWLALAGWQRSWSDWFWPAFLGIHVAELLYEHHLGGRGGGMIRFDDPTIRVATLAHVGGAAFGIVLWLFTGGFRALRPMKK
jgi:rhomboid family GlyGly-CTERM serine protease